MQILVVGGGAAGLIAAIYAARNGAAVTVLEKNDIFGKKLLATGNGRCNLTNRRQNPEKYHSSTPDFPWKVLTQQTEEMTENFFSNLGIVLKDRDGWLYPYSDQAQAVRDVLLMEARHLKVKLKTKAEVTGISKNADGFSVVCGDYAYHGDCVILASGSCASLPEGLGRDGYRLAETLGHKVISPLPALTGLRGIGNYFGKWAGTRFHAGVSLHAEGKILSSAVGELQFTEYGISGIPVFQISRFAAKALEEGKKVTAVIDFMPEMTVDQLVMMLEERLEHCSYKTMEEVLVGFLPKKLISMMVSDFLSVSDLAGRLKTFPVMIKATQGFAHAQVCAGGVSADEVAAETMESNIVSGLYFAGEIVDVDGECGGYNLQWAWSSGAMAGKSAAGGNRR